MNPADNATYNVKLHNIALKTFDKSCNYLNYSRVRIYCF